MASNPKSGSAELSRILAEMNQKGGFLISVLTDCEGFPVAAAANEDQDPEMQSAVVALVQKTANQVRTQLGMSTTDEITVYDKEGKRLVCRPMNINDHEMILAVLTSNRDQTYRRLTNQAVTAIRKCWRI